VRCAKGCWDCNSTSGPPPTVAQFKDIRLKTLRPATGGSPQLSLRIDPNRDWLLNEAMAYWDLGLGGLGARFPFKQMVDWKFYVRAAGAVMRDAYFDAGQSLHFTGHQTTAYLRVCDPNKQLQSPFTIVIERQPPRPNEFLAL
jgi:hypothetical protein